MWTRLKWILAVLGVFVAAGLAYYASMQFGLGEFQQAEAESASDDGDLAEMSPGERLCASQTTTDSIRQRIFARARTASSDDGALLSRLESGTVARMENPRMLDFDEGLEQARCEGRLVLELPRGTDPAFNYSRRLNARLEYVTQPVGDGRSSVYRMSGADDVIDRLADADLVTRRMDPADKEEPIDIGIEPDKDEFELEIDEPAPDEPGFEDADPLPPEDLLPPAMQEEEAE